MKYRSIISAVLLLAAACQKEADFVNPAEKPAEGNKQATLTLQATKGEAETKALSLVPGTPDHLDAYWKNTEKVKVYKAGTLLGTLDVTPAAGVKPTSATLSGSISTNGLAVNDVLTLMIPREIVDYSGQVGTLASIETSYDYATASITVASKNGNAITTTGGANFQNQQSIYRFGFKVGNGYINPKTFSVSAAGGLLVQSMSWSAGAWKPAFGILTVTPVSSPGDHFYYVSLRNDNTAADTYSFVITGQDDALYLATKAIPADALSAPGKFISAKSITTTKANFAATSGDISNPSEVL